LTPRAAAARTLAGILRDRVTLDEVLPANLRQLASPKDRAFAQELCYGVLRWYFRLLFAANLLLEKPLRSRDSEVLAVLLCGLYQMSFLRTPDHAAISESVEATREIGRPRAAPLLNAVLRRYQREREQIAGQIDAEPTARHAHPAWLLDAMRAEWPEFWERMAEAANGRPPLHLRVNRRRCSVDDYLRMLAASGFEGERLSANEAGVRLGEPVEIDRLPGFAEGLVSVQDSGAQFAAEILDARPGQRVLDACAAPGGKTCHILEREPGLAEVVAADRDASRLDLVQENLTRLGLNARVIHADVAAAGWFDGAPFDRILLDVPCSATGVIRRHPDIKLLRKPAQLPRYAATQDAVLAANWPLLLPGGRMLYSTCSLLRQENDARIEKFRNYNKDVRILEIGGTWGVATGAGRQTVPGCADTDGFYYALLEKT
jgi:16S rRNA (cytosine967-C5)-methyltransferase